MKIDGHEADEVGELGSWVCHNVGRDETYGKYQIREYYGLSSDIDKLPKYNDLATGSMAFCIDTGDVYFYDLTNKSWILQ